MQPAKMLRLLSLLLFLAMACFQSSAVVYKQTNLPNLRVNSITQDSLGFIWCATPNGLCRNLGTSFQVFLSEKDNPASLPSSNIQSLMYSHPDIWIATSRGVASKNIYKNVFERYVADDNETTCYFNGFLCHKESILAYGSCGLYKVNKKDKRLHLLCKFPYGEIITAICDSRDSIWLITGNMLICLGNNYKVSGKYQLPANLNVTSIAAYHNKILIGTGCGLWEFDSKNGSLSKALSGKMSSDIEIHSLLLVDDETLFVSTRKHGELICDMNTGEVSSSNNMYKLTGLPSSDIMSSFIDNNNNVWLGTLDMGLVLAYNRKSIFDIDRNLNAIFRDKSVTALASDRQNRFWIGTRYDGLFVYNPGTGTSTGIALPENNLLIEHIYIDTSDRVWVGTSRGLVVGASALAPEWESVRPLQLHMVSTTQDNDGNIWVGTSDNGIFVYNPDLSLRRHLIGNGMRNNNITNLIRMKSGNILISVYKDGLYEIDPLTYALHPLEKKYDNDWSSTIDIHQSRDGIIWICTYDHGLISYNPVTHSLRQYDRILPQGVSSVTEDSFGKIWISSSGGLYNLDPKSGLVRKFMNSTQLGDEYFHEKAVMHSSDGSLIFGSNLGLRQVSPQLDTDLYSPVPIYATSITSLFDGTDPLGGECDTPFINDLCLPHSQNSLCIDFVGLRYGTDIQYSYMLDGYDRDWVDAGANSRAVYSNLPTGSYTFRVRTRTSGNWSEPVDLLKIKVSPAPYLHPVAITAYCVLFVILMVLLVYANIRVRLQHERANLAEQKIVAERNLTAARINFFNNISHELRTPLTLILAPVQHLVNNFCRMSEKEINKNLEYISSNVQRMMHLTTQILNFREVHGETMPLAVSANNISSQLQNIVSIFNLYASERQISIELICHIGETSIWYDSDYLEKIMYNLIFNAIKYTPENGHISVRAELTKYPEYIASPSNIYLEITVTDDGIGIDRKQSKYLFARFIRLKSATRKRSAIGFGIGLNYVQKLVKMHHGMIVGKPNGRKGTTFVIDLPVDRTSFAPDEFAAETTQPLAKEELNEVSFADSNTGLTSSDCDKEQPETRKRVMLVVEDNKELVDFISSIFTKEFTVHSAADGLDGASKASELQPSVIISDIMMPVMDGIAMLSQLRNTPETSHIPVVILTAKNQDSDLSEGFDAGADIYLSKPFSPGVLTSAVHSVLANAELRSRRIADTAGSMDSSAICNDGISDYDRNFLHKLYDKIEKNMSNPELNINLLCQEMNMSRTSFYRKVLALTTLAPNDLLRVFRLNRAAEMLSSHRYNVGEVADLTGFSSHSYFSSLFRKHFGASPSEYEASHNRTNNNSQQNQSEIANI